MPESIWRYPIKRGTPEHPKLREFALQLGVPIYSATGLLELLWHFAAKYAHQGNIGKFTDAAIAAALGYEGTPDKLTSTMLASGWLDADSKHRLVIHHWKDHCDQTCRRYLELHDLEFITPDGIKSSENASTMLAGNSTNASTKLAILSPSPSPSPVPIANRQSPVPPIPASLDNPDFLKTWGEWLEHLRQKKRKPTPLALTRQLAKCEKIGQTAAVAMIQHSIEHNWQSLFEADGATYGPGNSQRRPGGIIPATPSSSGYKKPTRVDA